MKRYTIKAYGIQTIDWYKGKVVDWNSAGTVYDIDGKKIQLQESTFGFQCDRAITSENGVYAFIYKKVGTKGLLLKNGELLREINRSYYQSEVYEFPAAFLDHNGRTYLVHCPNSYRQLDIEDVETGKIISNIPGRAPADAFHSRLVISPDNKFILSKGWYWHPWDFIELFNVQDCFANPLLLDEGIAPPDVSTEICSASFINENKILMCTSKEEAMDDENEGQVPPGHLAIWDIQTNEFRNKVKVKEETGNVFAINDKMCWDLYEYPKIISLETGVILHKEKSIFSGKQNSSIIHYLDNEPMIAYDKISKQIAIAQNDKIDILVV